MTKGTCQHKTKYFNLITVTDKGQIAIPTQLRKALGIEKGTKLMIVKREDNQGFNLLKVEIMQDFISKISLD